MSLVKLPPSNSSRLLRAAAWLLAAVSALLIIFWWPSPDNMERKLKVASSPSHTSSHPAATKREQSAKIVASAEKPTKSATRREAPLPSGRVTTFSVIGELLANDRLSQDESARELAKIALDSQVLESDRLEAMDHGKNLGFSHMLPLSLDPKLPLPLAESFLHGLYGHDQPKEQVSGALGLLHHVDPDIRQQAEILLGFLLGAEEDIEAPEASDRLREKADAFLKQPDEESEEVIGH